MGAIASATGSADWNLRRERTGRSDEKADVIVVIRCNRSHRFGDRHSGRHDEEGESLENAHSS